MKRFAYIDSLRGIAILLVILHHCHPYFSGNPTTHLSKPFELLLNHGDQGVILFYVMSAFTLCLSFKSKKENESNYIFNYFIRRGFRIIPLYYFSVFAFCILYLEKINTSAFIANLLLVHGTNPYWINAIIPGGWSVGIEVIFYILFPITFYFIKNSKSAIYATLFSLLSSKVIISLLSKTPLIIDHALWGTFVYECIFSQLPVFFIGMTLFFFWEEKNESYVSPKQTKAFIFIALVIILDLFAGSIFKQHYIFAIAFAIFAFGLSNYQAPIIVNKITITIGKLSYSLYLMHLLVFSLLKKYDLNHFNSNANIDVILRFLILFSSSFMISIFSYWLIELPFQTLGKKLITRLEKGKETLL